MKSSEKQLREALQLIQAEYKFMLDDSAVTEITKPSWIRFGKWVYEQTQEALAASETTDLDRLVEALTKPAYEVVDEHGDVWWTMPKEIFDNIADEFGVGEGE